MGLKMGLQQSMAHMQPSLCSLCFHSAHTQSCAHTLRREEKEGGKKKTIWLRSGVPQRTRTSTDPDGQTRTRSQELRRAMNYNTLCLKLSSCLHSSTLTSSLSTSLPLLFPLCSFFFFLWSFIFHLPLSRAVSISPHLLFFSDSIYFDIYLLSSVPFCSSTPALIYSACLPPSLPSLLHLISLTWLQPPPPSFIASGGWSATVSFNPSRCRLQTPTVTLHRRYQSLGAIKGGPGRNHSSRAAD